MTMNNLAQYTMNQVDENVQGVTTIDQVKKGLGQEAYTNRALVEDMIKGWKIMLLIRLVLEYHQLN